MRPFDNRVALVTGAGSGIGQAVALELSAGGCRLALADIDAKSLDDTAAMIVDRGGSRPAVYQTDVSKPADVDRLFESLSQEFESLDIAVNNAGVGMPPGPTESIPEEVFDTVIGVNLKGVFLCLQHELRAMASKGGAIVNMASALGLVARKDYSPYIASKHALIGLTKAVALDHAENGIRVNAVCPGIVRTPLAERRSLATPEKLAAAIAVHPIGRLGTPEDIAQAVAWLASDAASFCTGTAMAVDGGWSA